MAIESVLHVSVTSFRLISGHLSEPVRKAMCQWCEFHGIDPHQVPMWSTIVRNLEDRCVEYDRIIRREDGFPAYDGHRVVVSRERAQGETEPLPWPDAVAAYLVKGSRP